MVHPHLSQQLALGKGSERPGPRLVGALKEPSLCHQCASCSSGSEHLQ